MELNIASLIGSVGFPCAMCIFLVYYMETSQRSMQSAITELKQAILILTERIK